MTIACRMSRVESGLGTDGGGVLCVRTLLRAYVLSTTAEFRIAMPGQSSTFLNSEFGIATANVTSREDWQSVMDHVHVLPLSSGCASRVTDGRVREGASRVRPFRPLACQSLVSNTPSLAMSFGRPPSLSGGFSVSPPVRSYALSSCRMNSIRLAGPRVIPIGSLRCVYLIPFAASLEQRSVGVCRGVQAVYADILRLLA